MNILLSDKQQDDVNSWGFFSLWHNFLDLIPVLWSYKPEEVPGTMQFMGS